MICGRCGSSNLFEARFCGSCGAALAGGANLEQIHSSTAGPIGLGRPGKDAAERRQLTVLFCDLVGSTSLAERLDPEELRDLICEYQQVCLDVVRRNEGHIAQYLGDGVLIYFGYPVAHEDEARRAVRSALAILAGVKELSKRLQQQSRLELSVRIGCHTGQVVVGEVGSGDSRIQALGEALNLAARAQNLADPDTIVISAATYQLVEPFFICQDLGTHFVKGIAHPVKLYRALAETGTQTRMQAAATRGMALLVGREHEIKFLLECWERAKEGRGRSVLVTGEPGIGKSRILEELKQRLAGEAYCLQGYCSSYQQNTAFAPISDLLRHALGITAEDSAQEKLSKLNAAMPRLAFESNGVIPLIAEILSVPLSANHSPLDLTPVRQRQLTLEALTSWLLGTAKDQPLLFIMEDLHWADPSTLELLALVMRDQHTQRIMILLSSRPEFSTRWPTHVSLHEMALPRLTPEQTLALATNVAQNRTLPVEVLREVVKRTDGVPLFVEELTKMVLDSGFLELVNGSYELKGALPPRAIPSTVQDLLMARLDRLGSEKTLAQIGAILGHEFSYDVLQAVSHIDEKTLQRDLECLIRADLVTQNGSPPRATYVFKHALIRDAAYESLLKSIRRQYHQRIAEVLEKDFPEIAMTAPELLAQHFTSCGFDQKAIGYWEKAGKRALERAADREAIVHLQKALEVLKNLGDRSVSQKDDRVSLEIELDLQLSLMVAFMAIEGWASQKVEACCLRAHDLSLELRDNQSIFGASWGLWTVHFLRGELETALDLAEKVLNMAMGANNKMLQVMGYHAVGFTRYFRGELLEAKRHATDGIRLFDLETEKQIVNAFQFSSTMALRFFLSSSLWFLGKPEESSIELDHASYLIADLNHAPSTAAFMAFKLSSYLYLRDLKRMRETAGKLKELNEENGFRLYVPVEMMYSGWALVEEGDTDEGFRRMERGVAEYRSTGSLIKFVEVQVMHAEVLRKVGFTERALDAIEDGIAQASRRQEHLLEPELYRIRGEIRLGQGDERAAAMDFDRAMDFARGQGALSLELRAAMSKCQLLRKQGKINAARRQLSNVYDCFTEGFNTRDLVEANSLIGELCAP
jgi:class 3 adenylate cyclase